MSGKAGGFPVNFDVTFLLLYRCGLGRQMSSFLRPLEAPTGLHSGTSLITANFTEL